MRKKELQRQLDEKNERIELLSRRVETMQTLINNYQQREQAIVDAMAGAQDMAKRRCAEATAQAEALLSDAKTRAETERRAARNEADALKRAAKAEAEAVLSAARAESAALLSRTEEAVSEYEKQIQRYNEVIEKSAAEAMQNTARYAALLRERKLPAPELAEEVAGISSVPLAGKMDLPDAADDPKLVMRNIYQLQNRDIPFPIGEEARPAFTGGEPVGRAEAPAEADGTKQAQAAEPDVQEEARPAFTGGEPIGRAESPAEAAGAQQAQAAEPDMSADARPAFTGGEPIGRAESPAETAGTRQAQAAEPDVQADAPPWWEQPQQPQAAPPHEAQGQSVLDDTPRAQPGQPEAGPVVIPKPSQGEYIEPEEVPTVTKYLVEEEVDAPDAYELSLDDLLNEIIQAGDRNNG